MCELSPCYSGLFPFPHLLDQNSHPVYNLPLWGSPIKPVLASSATHSSEKHFTQHTSHRHSSETHTHNYSFFLRIQQHNHARFWFYIAYGYILSQALVHTLYSGDKETTNPDGYKQREKRGYENSTKNTFTTINKSTTQSTLSTTFKRTITTTSNMKNRFYLQKQSTPEYHFNHLHFHK